MQTKIGLIITVILVVALHNNTYAGDKSLKNSLRFRVNSTEYIRQFDPIFKRPILNGKDAIPVGNGDLAAVAWQPDHLTWMLNKCDIGIASQVARLRIETPDKISERIGTLTTRLALENATGTIQYKGGKLPECSGWMWRGKSGPKPKITAKDLGTVDSRFFVTEGKNVFILSYNETAKTAHPVSVLFERWVQKEYGKNVKAEVRGKTLAITYQLKKNNYADSYAAVLAFDGFDGAVLKSHSAVSTALEIPAGTVFKGRIAIAVVTSLEAKDPLAAATALATSTLKQPESEVKQPHDAFWRQFWDRFLVDAGHPYLSALYQISLYELGITSRGARPVKFNGALNLFSEKARTWGMGYWCHNQSEAYLQVYTANHVELADNFHDWIARVRPEAVKDAKKKFQVKGAHYAEVMTWNQHIKDPDIPVKPSGTGWILSSGVRYALMMWNRYQYTLDNAFLREKAWPVIRDCAEFYVDYAKLGDDGLYHVGPAISWEEPPIGRDTHADCAAWRAIFPIAIRVARQLRESRDRIPIWQDRLAKAPPYPIQDNLFSVVMRNDGTPEPTNHFQWQLPNLSSVFPYSVIGISADQRMKQLADDTFSRYRYNADAGHEFLPVITARLGNSEWWRSAMFRYIQYFQCHDQGLFNYYNLHGSKMLELGGGDDAHPYLEGSGIMATGVNEMLLQSYDGIIRVFPAVPERWQARFILRAAGSFMVASEHRGRTGIRYIAIQPVGGAKRLCRVAIPWKGGVELVSNKKPVKFQKSAGNAEFMTRPGQVYLLTPKGVKIDSIPMVDVAFKKSYSPCRIGNTWIGSRDGQMNHTSDFPLW